VTEDILKPSTSKKKLYITKLHDLYPSPDVVNVIKRYVQAISKKAL